MPKKRILLTILAVAFLIKNSYAQIGNEKEISRPTAGKNDAQAYDLDNDGDLDIVEASGDNRIAWYENLGGGTFGPQITISDSINNTYSVRGGDFDADGDTDLVASSFDDNKVVWFENLGSGDFSNEKIISVNSFGARAVFCVDLDTDGQMDVLIASSLDDKIAWFRNLGSGNFGPESIISSVASGVSSVYAADLDNDNDIDVIAALTSSDQIVWHENLGSGIFDTMKVITSLTDDPLSVFAIDLDNDGDIDVISGSANDNKVAWYENSGLATFGTQNIIHSAALGVHSVYATDMDNDGDADIFSASSVADRVYRYENLGSGVFGTRIAFNPRTKRAQSVSAGDLDGDGKADVIATSWSQKKVVWFENLGLNSFSDEKEVSASLNNLKDAHACDIDGDGDNDVLVATYYDDKIAWYENLGNGVFSRQWIIQEGSGNGPEKVRAGDMDGDGDLDVLMATSSAYWFENIGGKQFSAKKFIAPNTNIIALQAVDMDGDNDMDVLTVHGVSYTGKVAWQENNGSGIFIKEHVLSSSLNLPRDGIAIDLDNDGDMDVAVVTDYGNEVIWFENLGAGTFGAAQIISNQATNAKSVYAADVDKDGDNDIISASYKGNKVAWYENQGSSGFSSEKIISTAAFAVTSICAKDVDGDGLIDVVSGGENGDLLLHKNLGGGNFDANHAISNSNSKNISSVFLEDLDEDGDNDVLYTYGHSFEEVLWRENFYQNFKLEGNVFYDANQDGVYNHSERGLSFIKTNINPLGDFSFTNAMGKYTYVVDSSVYTIGYDTSSQWRLTTDSTNYTVQINTSNRLVGNLNFGFYPTNPNTEILPLLTAGFPRCNGIVNFWLQVRNEGTTTPSGTIELRLADSLKFVSADITPDSINGQSLFWHYDSLYFFENKIFNLRVAMPDFRSIGDTMVSTIDVLALNGGNIVYSSVDSLVQILQCAFDPNDKIAIPMGEGAEGFIKKNQELDYVIRFQNTGNDTAINVVVKDQLDVNLNWDSFSPIASSHPMEVTLNKKGEVKFVFNDIFLPDSNVNEPLSHGFVRFSIRPKDDLMQFTEIRNSGRIFFDENPAIVTNVQLNTIECYSLPELFITYNKPYLVSSIKGQPSYRWYLNNELIPSSNLDSILPATGGIYKLEVDDHMNSCFKRAYFGLISTVISESNSPEFEFTVYPNPFWHHATIKFDITPKGSFSLVLRDAMGNEVSAYKNLSQQKVILSRGNMKSGVYFLTIEDSRSGEIIFMEKLMVY